MTKVRWSLFTVGTLLVLIGLFLWLALNIGIGPVVASIGVVTAVVGLFKLILDVLASIQKSGPLSDPSVPSEREMSFRLAHLSRQSIEDRLLPSQQNVWRIISSSPTLVDLFSTEDNLRLIIQPNKTASIENPRELLEFFIHGLFQQDPPQLENKGSTKVTADSLCHALVALARQMYWDMHPASDLIGSIEVDRIAIDKNGFYPWELDSGVWFEGAIKRPLSRIMGKLSLLLRIRWYSHLYKRHIRRYAASTKIYLSVAKHLRLIQENDGYVRFTHNAFTYYARLQSLRHRLDDPKAVDALGNMDSFAVELIPDLISKLEGHLDHRFETDELSNDLRISIIQALGGLADARAVPILVRTIIEDSVWSTATEALNAIPGDEGARRLAYEVAHSSETDRAFRQAVYALRELDALSDLDRLTTIEASHALSALEFAGVHDPSYVSDPRMLSAIGRLNEQNIQSLIQRFRDDEVGAQDEIRRTFIAIGSPAVPHLIPLLRDTEARNPRIRWDTAYVLSQIQDSRVVPALIQIIQDKELSTDTAAKKLGELGDRTAIEPLKVALGFSNRIASAAAQALATLGEGEYARPFLMRCLTEGNDTDRINAVRGLAAIGDISALEAIVASLDDDEHWVRKTAVEVLGATQHTRYLPFLIEALGDQRDTPWSGLVVDEAMNAIRAYGRRALPSLKHALENASSIHREHIERLIRDIEDK